MLQSTMLQLIAFFLVCGAWCAMKDSYESLYGLPLQCVEAPCTWQILDKDLGGVKVFHGSFGWETLWDGFKVTSDQGLLQSDYIELTKKETHVQCNLWHHGIETTGEIFSLQVWKNPRDVGEFRASHNGTFTLYDMLYSADRGCVIIKNCQDGSERELFALQDVQRTDVFSEYTATENSLSMTRFFGANGEALFFVKMLVDYNAFYEVAVSWGVRNVDETQGVYSDNTQGHATLPLTLPSAPSEEDMDVS